MGYISVPSGANIPLQLQLFDGLTNQYPRARVYNSAFTEISGSPFNLTHLAGGLYLNTTSIVAPADGIYTAIYTVYSNSGHTTVNKAYSIETDTFSVDSTTSSRQSTSTALSQYSAIIGDIDDGEGQITN